MSGQREPIHIPRLVVFLAVGQFIIKLLLINWYKAEYTDSIIQLTLFDKGNDNNFFPPLFSALSRLIEVVVLDPVFSGRLVSIFASSMTVLPVFMIGRRIWTERAGIFSAVCYSVSAIQWRWSVRAMTDPLFTLFFMLAIWAFLEGALGHKKAPAWWSFFWAGMATLTRYQGLILLPLAIWASWRARKDHVNRLWLLFVFLPWVALVAWLNSRGVGHAGQFEERAAGGLQNVLLAYLSMAEGFAAFLPYALTYPFFAAMIIGLARGMDLPKGKMFGWITLYLVLPWLVIHAAFQSFQYRYFLPLVPIFALWAGEGVNRLHQSITRCLFIGIIATWGIVFSILILVCQRGTFGDLRASAEILRSMEQFRGHIYSDEVYRPGVENSKMRFWSDMYVQSIPKDLHFLDTGDLVILHNVYSDLDLMAKELQSRFKVREMFSFREEILPLLPDIMVTPPVTSQPACMDYRYCKQQFLSIGVVIEGRNTPTGK